MKIITTYLPEAHLRMLKEVSREKKVSRSELIRQAIRDLLEVEEKYWISRFFEYCVYCESKLTNPPLLKHLFHKNIEVFELRFCCHCYEQFKDRLSNEIPEFLINIIQKKIKKYKKYMELFHNSDSTT